MIIFSKSLELWILVYGTQFAVCYFNEFIFRVEMFKTLTSGIPIPLSKMIIKLMLKEDHQTDMRLCFNREKMCLFVHAVSVGNGIL